MAVVFCDSNCELWYDKARELGLKVIQMPYTLDGVEHFYDLGEKTDFKHFYAEVRSGKIPVTSALNAENYREYFEPYFKAGEDILYISFSDQLSATFNYMDLAVKDLRAEYPNVKFVRFDTKGISMTEGIQVYLAKKYFDSGKTIDETVAYLKEITKHIFAEFVVDDLKHLKRGGRVSGAAAAIGTLLNMKPILKVTDEGKLVNTIKVSGKTKALTYLAGQVKEKGLDVDKYPIVIMHADCEEDALKLKEKIIAETGNPNLDIWIQPVGPVIGTHCGAGTIALIFYAISR
ncbi:MAG: DegV family protein [Clostridiales bacterium]|jgi:DegV family protein with EDD domain|nr:DegV family protein [Clostridiales bacterium]